MTSMHWGWISILRIWHAPMWSLTILAAGYRAMGQDAAREQDALAWSETLVGDAA